MARPQRGERHREDRFAELEAFLEEHGKQPSERAEDPEQRELALWFRQQCHALMRGGLAEASARELQKFDVQPTAQLSTWAKRIDICIDTLRKRMQDTVGVDGLTINGRLLRGAFYTKSQIEQRCLDLLIPPEKIRTELKQRFTPEAWAEMSSRERHNIDVRGRKLNALARLFGIEGDPLNRSLSHLKLGQAIWGDHACFRERLIGAQEIRAELRKRFTADEWVKMSKQKRRNINIHGKKLRALAQLLGVDGNPIGYTAVHRKLGQVIWGDRACFRTILLGSNGIRAELKRRFTPEEWMEMPNKERGDIDVRGLKLNALARLFGVEGNPVVHSVVHQELGQAIFGAQPIFTAEGRRETIRTELKRQFTPKEWAWMSIEQRRCIEVNGKKLRALARFFGVEGDPINYAAIHLKVGGKIWGNQPIFARNGKREIMRAAIKQRFTPEQWLGIHYNRKKDIEVHGRKLYAITSLFDVEGDPISSSAIYLQLGRAIWGKEWPDDLGNEE